MINTASVVLPTALANVPAARQVFLSARHIRLSDLLSRPVGLACGGQWSAQGSRCRCAGEYSLGQHVLALDTTSVGTLKGVVVVKVSCIVCDVRTCEIGWVGALPLLAVGRIERLWV
jgi:hypothetical protein